jgi:hypothetical protein
VPSINRVFFLSFGGVCFLIIPFFWLALAFDYKALENFMVTLSESHFVGYPIPELFGASRADSVVSQVFRLKIFFSLALLFYSLFFISLYSVEENSKRLRFLFRGISIPLFLLVVAFWLKFVGEDHIVVKSEKNELFIATTVSLVFSILLFVYSFRSQKKKSRINPLKVPNQVSISSANDNPDPLPQTQNDLSIENESTPPVDLHIETPVQNPSDVASSLLSNQPNSAEIETKSDSKEITLNPKTGVPEQSPTLDLEYSKIAKPSSEDKLPDEVDISGMSQTDDTSSVKSLDEETSKNSLIEDIKQ